MLSSREFLLPAIYHTRGHFSSLAAFMRRIGKNFDSAPFNKETTLTELRNLIEKFNSSVNKSAIDQKMAEHILIARDLKEIERQVITMEDFNPSDVMLNDFEKLLTEASSFGFNVESVQIYQVDEFPKPFSEMKWTFFNADRADEEKYGIPYGIYIKKTSAIPIYTTFLLSHELVHVAVGVKNSNKIARGLEEGIAEILGCMLLFSHTKGRRLAENLLIYNRLNYPPNQFWEVYLDNLRQAIFIYFSFGLDGLLELVKSGRDRIKEVERLMLEGRFKEITLPKGTWDDDVDYLASLVFTFPRHYVVSPLAKYISGFIQKGRTITDILNTNNINLKDGDAAVRELGQKLFLVVIKDGLIANCDMETISEHAILRYLLD